MVELQISFDALYDVSQRPGPLKRSNASLPTAPILLLRSQVGHAPLERLHVVAIEPAREPGVDTIFDAIERGVWRIDRDPIGGTAEETRLQRVLEGDGGEWFEERRVVGDDADGIRRDCFVCYCCCQAACGDVSGARDTDGGLVRTRW